MIAVTQEQTEQIRKKGTVILNDKFEIFPQKPIKHLQKKEIDAYEVKSIDGSQTNHIAYVSDSNLLCRHHDAVNYGGVINANIVKMTGAGIVYWPDAQEQRYCYIYENNLGKPLMGNLQDDQELQFKQEQVNEDQDNFVSDFIEEQQYDQYKIEYQDNSS